MSTNQLVCVRRPELGLSSVFEDMYLNERLVDVTLSCCDGQLQAHKLVLAASSSYFSNLFDKLANPFHYPVIVMKDMQIDDLKLIVDFMYRGQLTITQERFMNLTKSAENLQITGLSRDGVVEGVAGTNLERRDSSSNNNNNNNSNSNGNNNNLNSRNAKPRFKGSKKASTNLSSHSAIFSRAYHSHRQDEIEDPLSPQPSKLLEQSMITGESIGDSHQFPYANSDPTSTRNLNQLHTPSPSSIHVQQHLSNIDHQQHQQQLSNQLQVLSHSLTANRSSLTQASSNGQQSSHMSQQTSRGRVHPCNICWKTFREKANLKRHLQVHSLDRVVYACPDCNKTFSWKDNYIRHTKTAHHMNNVRPQA